MVMSKKGKRGGKKPPTTYDQADVQKALESVADEVAANRGRLPRGAFVRAAGLVGCDPSTVKRWYDGNRRTTKEEVEATVRVAVRTHAEQKAHIQEKAAHIMDRILDCAASMVEAQANGEQRTIISKQGNAFDVDYLSPKELAEVGKLIRETTFAERDPLEAVRQIEIILPEGRVEPLPKDPPPPPSTGGS